MTEFCQILSPNNLAVDREWLAHGALHVQSLDIVPVLLQQRNQEVDSHQRILPNLICCHVHMPDGNTHTENLLQLKLHLAADLGDLRFEIVSVLNEGWELASFVQARSQETWDLRDENLRRYKGIEGLGKLLNKLLVLVQLLQVLDALEGDVGSLGLLAMDCITKHAYLHTWAWHVGELDGACETFVTLGVVILQANDQFDRLQELPRLLLEPSRAALMPFLEQINAELRHAYTRADTFWSQPLTLDPIVPKWLEPKWLRRLLFGTL